MRIRLLFLSGPNQGKTFPLPEGKIVTLGRGEGNDICIPDNTCSRIHCQIENSGSHCVISDMNSANGSMVNGEKITEKALQIGDQIVLGSSRLRAIADTGHAPQAASAGARVVVECVKCGARILQSDLRSGRAILTPLGHACPRCAPGFASAGGADRESPTMFPGAFEEAGDVTLERVSLQYGPYRSVAVLSPNSIGPVYVARREQSDREVELQIVGEKLAGDEPALRSYLKSVKAAKGLVHPNLRLARKTESAEGVHYVVLDRFAGRRLDELLEQGEAMPASAVVSMAAQLAGALDYLHSKDYCHCDVQPEFVTVADTGVVKLGGMGLAGPVGGDSPIAHFKSSRGAKYLVYAAPELLSPQGVASVRADLYSLGAVLYHSCTGQPPFPATSVDETMDCIASGTVASVDELTPDLPHILALIIGKCMAHKPDSRYVDAQEFLLDLEDAAMEVGQ